MYASINDVAAILTVPEKSIMAWELAREAR